MEAVRHVIVLMLENRSFDHLLGYLDHPDQAYERLDPSVHRCRLDPGDPSSEVFAVRDDASWTLPVDPDHSHRAVMRQLGIVDGGSPVNDGFVSSYEEKASGRTPDRGKTLRRTAVGITAAAAAGAVVSLVVGAWIWAVAAAALGAGAEWARRRFLTRATPVPGSGPLIMKCFAPDRLPVLATLAREYAVCTRWFCSVPGETWPNRQFLHAATSAGTVDISMKLYEDATIFEQLEDAGHSWRIYHDGPPQAWAFRELWRAGRLGNWRRTESLAGDIRRGDLPTYTFVEPCHGLIGRPNSQHPGDNVDGPDSFLGGERLIADIYTALRQTPEVFRSSLLVITYDEHGGTYDHVPPPPTVAPDDRRSPEGFDFTLLGPRVPAVLVSPWIPAETIDSTVYDHSSVAATLRALFAPAGAPLTKRAAAANTFHHNLSLTEPRTDLPTVEPIELPMAATRRATTSSETLNDFQMSLVELSMEVEPLLASDAPRAGRETVPTPRRSAAEPPTTRTAAQAIVQPVLTAFEAAAAADR